MKKLCAVVLMALGGLVARGAQELVLAERGKSAACTIVVTKDAGPSLRYAAEELQRYVKELTGVELPVAAADAINCVPPVGGSQLAATVTDKAGGSQLAATVKGTAAIRLELTEDYGADGFRLVARPPDLVVRGGVRGCLYGVYELLETYGGVGWYASWRTVVPKLDRFLVPADLDDVQRPAFTMRMTSWLDATRGDFAARLRLNGSRARLEEKHGGAVCRFGKHMGSCHTFNFLLPAKKYFAEHPEYFAMRDGKRELREKSARWGYTQPCLTNPDVLRIVTSNVLEAIKADPTAGIYGVSQNDNRLYCQCPACAAVDEEEESHAGTVVRFVNAVAEEVEKHYPNAIIETLAYQYSRKPPKKTRLRHNVMPCLCSIECDFHKPLDVSPFKSNVDFVEDIRGWTRQTDMLYLWDYTTNFRNYLHAFPNIMALQGNLKFFRANNVKYMFEQGDSLGLHADFGELRAWLLAKWMWNPDAPMAPLLDRFFKGYYGAAAPHARKVFDDLYSLPRDSVTQRLGIYEVVTSTNIPTAFFERAEKHWLAAAEAVKGDRICARNVEAAYLSTMFSLLYRLPRPRTVWVTRHPENFNYDRCRAYAQRLLAARKPFNLRFAESGEREKTFREEIAAMAAAVVPTTGCDRAEVPASRLRLSVPGVRGEYAKDAGTLDGTAIKLFNTHYEWSVRLDLASVAYDPDVTYKVRVRVRVEKELGAKGEAFWAGVYDTPAKKGRGSISVKAEKCDDGYAWYDVCKWKPRDGQYFWLGPGRFKKNGGVSAIKSVWVDRVEISRVDSAVRAEVVTADLVIYGSSPAAVSAAVKAVDMGLKPVIVSPERHVGGLTVSGLGFTDSGNTASIGGLARQFYHRIYLAYQDPSAWRWERMEDFKAGGQGTKAIVHSEKTMWTFEPHVAERVFAAWLAEKGVPVRRGECLDREGGVKKADGRIVSITTLSGNTYRGRYYIDATYEGDLMAAAGVPYRVGRESCSEFGETWNGNQVGVLHHKHHFRDWKVSPYKIPGDPSSGLCALVDSSAPGVRGAGDRRVQAYCYRLCMTDDPRNRIPFEKPSGYDPARYELLARVYAQGYSETFAKFDRIANHKTDTNNHGPVNFDYLGGSYEWPEASYARRAELAREHRDYQMGLLYFLANDPSVPADVRRAMSKWGLAKDEFADNGGWPYHIYVREGRRMVGAYVMTEHDCLGTPRHPAQGKPYGPVGMGSYNLDSHNVRRYVTAEGFVQNEGDIGVHPKRPYGIDYGAIVPRREACRNLLVPVALSATHTAFGSIRMEPVFMLLGESAATAAALAAEDGRAVQDVPYAALSARLRADGQILEL